MICARHLCLVVALSVPVAAGAERVVDHGIDDAKAAQDAVEQGVPLTPTPARGPFHIALETMPDVDHEVIRAGIACGAWKIRNPLSLLVRRFAVAWDREGAPADAIAPSVDLLLKVTRASTLSRCISTGEMKSSCIYRVTINGSVMTRDGAVHPIRAEQESAAKGIGVCAGLTRGIALVSRAATAALIKDAGDFMSAVTTTNKQTEG